MEICSDMDYQDVLKAAVKKYGYNTQFNQLIEECAELIVEINHLKRGKKDLLPLLEELVDVRIMLDQMDIIFDRSLIEKIKERKIKRLAQYIADE
jgi:NTP pyrophosphatase (non-canonical NTP hydrolase)